MRRSRRALLATMGAAGLAGCSLSLADLRGTPDSPANTETSPPPTATPTDEPRYRGETIPPTSHPPSRTEPLIAGPLEGVDNPILTATDVTDFGDATFVADPFLFVEEDTMYLFFEVYNETRNRPDAAIAVAHSTDALEWEYGGIVLEKEYHTSFPLVWKWRGEYYMCPPTGRDVELWRARSFPGDWVLLGELIDVEYYPHDPVVFRHDDRWWLVTDRGYSEVMVYYSEELESFGWTPHPDNPVVTDRIEAARPGGRPVVLGETPHLFFQDLTHEYGDKIRAFEVVELSREAYRDREVPESPVLAESGVGWNAEAMHTFDPWWVGDGWICAVDGEVADRWSIGLYYAPADVTVDTGKVPYEFAFAEGYYAFENSERIAVDHSGNGRHGTVYGAESETADGLAGLDFAEDDSRVVFPCPFRAPLGTDAFTIVTYVRPAEYGGRRTLFDYGSVDERRYLRVERSALGRWDVSANGADGVPEFSAETGAVGEPTQVALTGRAGAGARVFVGAERRGTGEAPGDVAGSHSYLVLGADRAGNAPWRGWIGPMGVFSTALSERELARVDERVRRGAR